MKKFILLLLILSLTNECMERKGSGKSMKSKTEIEKELSCKVMKTANQSFDKLQCFTSPEASARQEKSFKLAMELLGSIRISKEQYSQLLTVKYKAEELLNTNNKETINFNHSTNESLVTIISSLTEAIQKATIQW